MKKAATLIQSFAFSAALGLTACGGGGGGGDGNSSKVTCADFTYQEDAQAYFNANNAKQLDADNDGRACEALPNRPAPVPAPAPAPASTAEGLWIGSTSTARTVTGIVLDNGTYWVLYSSPNNSAVIAGAVQGSGTSFNGNFSSSDGKDFNLEGLGISNVTVSASYVAKQSFNGSVTYPSSSQNVTFASAYNAAYDQTPSLSAIAGTYAGSAAVVAGSESATVTITSGGAISGSGTSGCQFTGTTAPRAKGNVYDLVVTFGGGVCSNGTSTVTGIGYFDASVKRLYGTALNSARSNGFIFVGTKP